MFMTPQTGMSTPGRKNIHEVRQQVSTTFKLLGSKAPDHDASNWESEARRARFGLQECDKDDDDDAASTSSLSSSKSSTEASKIKSMEEQALRIQLLESQKEAVGYASNLLSASSSFSV